jgi:membrane protease YdiL (CAAX protease family)
MINTTINSSAIETPRNAPDCSPQQSKFLPHRLISAKTIGLSLLLGFTSVCPAMLLASVFPVSWLARHQFEAVAAAPLMAILTHVLLGPFLEEIIYRGLLLQLARRYMPSWAAVLLSSGVFAATHFPGGLGLMVPVFVMGCVLGWLVVRTNSLYTSFLCHATFNLTAGFVVAPMFVMAQELSAVSPDGKINLTAIFPAWWIVLSITLAIVALVLLAREFSRRKQ